jgi:NAD(P)-dependent dehydrogenase (short-subunit alcohol dehydrogenase family)
MASPPSDPHPDPSSCQWGRPSFFVACHPGQPGQQDVPPASPHPDETLARSGALSRKVVLVTGAGRRIGRAMASPPSDPHPDPSSCEWGRPSFFVACHPGQPGQQDVPPGSPHPDETLARSGALSRKVVLVTGAARRIGRAIALRLAAEGARVAIHYNLSESGAARTLADCGAAAAGLFRADLASVPQIARLFAEIEQRCGRLDGLVNNAGRFARIDPLDITEQDWDFIHSVNLKAVFFCCQHAARLMKKTGGGRIVNISSLGGLRPWAMHAHYCASKAGVIMLTRALAKAFAPEITVNSVAPGVIPCGDDLDDRTRRMIQATPARRAGTPDEVADAVVYFLKASNFITGQTLAVDGGLSQR